MKSKLRKWCIRLSSLLAVLAFVLVMVVPANAKVINWQDYCDYIVHHDDGTSTCYFEYGSMYGAIGSYVCVFDRAGDGYNLVYDGIGEFHDIPFVPGHDYRISIHLFGPEDSDNGLDLNWLPAGSTISSHASFVYDNNSYPDNSWSDEDLAWSKIPTPVVKYQYYPASGRCLLEDSYTLTNYTGVTYPNVGHDYIIKDISGANSFHVEFYWEMLYWESDPCPVGVRIPSPHFSVTVPTDDYILDLAKRIEARRHDDITIRLDNSNDKLDLIQSAMDSALNILGTHDYDGDGLPDPPLTNEQLDKWLEHYHGTVEGVSPGSGDLRQDYNQLIGTFGNNFNDIANSLHAVSWLISLFTNLPLFGSLISISLALGLTGTILGIVNTATRSRGDGAKSKDGKKK